MSTSGVAKHEDSSADRQDDEHVYDFGHADVVVWLYVSLPDPVHCAQTMIAGRAFGAGMAFGPHVESSSKLSQTISTEPSSGIG
jgi:hypothetical protein